MGVTYDMTITRHNAGWAKRVFDLVPPFEFHCELIIVHIRPYMSALTDSIECSRTVRVITERHLNECDLLQGNRANRRLCPAPNCNLT